MDAAIIFLLAVGGTVLGVAAFYQLFWMAVSALSRRESVGTTAPSRKRFCVLIPAHNEELLIGDLLASLHAQRYPRELVDVVVIADNCNDRTAPLAREAGAQCLERHDLQRRGKPYALDWAIAQLPLARYDAFVIIDADTIVHPDFLSVMAGQLERGHKVLQGYFGVMNPDENWLTRLAILPGVLKFKLHFPGKNRLGFSCPLAGNGMCFAREIFARFGWNAYSLAENWEYYAMLTLFGYRVESAQHAIIYSQVTTSLKKGRTQRMRWLKGRMETLQRYWWPLLKSGLRGRVRNLDALFEIARPSHSMLLFWSIGYLALCAALGWSGVVGGGWAAFAAAVFAAQVLYFLSGLVVQRAPLRTWLSLFMVPPYLAWKFALSLAGMLSLGDKRWIKTERHKVG